MGNQLAGIAPSQIFPVDHYLTKLPDFTYDLNLGSTRFFKVARAKHKEGLIVVKVFVIHDPTLPLTTHRDRVEVLKIVLSAIPNCLPFQKTIESNQQTSGAMNKIKDKTTPQLHALLLLQPYSHQIQSCVHQGFLYVIEIILHASYGTALTENAGFLVRQYIKDNLYDRISTRPFLNNIEKRWIAFQLLQCLNQCHKQKVCHGDIKLENIMITSWNWVLVTDFANFKPTYLPEDDPADFSYFFDTSHRRTCYVAPERFVTFLTTINVHDDGATTLIFPDEIKKGDLTPAMDVFSLGCAITELFTEGHAPFDFSQLLRYRNKAYDPWNILEKIDDLHIRELVHSMIQMDHTKRLSIEEYLQQQRNKAFPEYFYTFLEPYVINFTSVPIPSPDEKVGKLKKDIALIVEEITAYEKSLGTNSNSSSESTSSEGLVLIVPLLTSCLRALKHCTAKLNALDVIRVMASCLSPDVILDRLLPYLIFLVRDDSPRVRSAAIHTIKDCLLMVKSLPRSDSNIFPEYIFPNLSHIVRDDAVIVRMAYAENIAILAETALRFLEMTQIVKETDPDSTLSTDSQHNHQNQVSYDKELQTLQELVQQNVTTLLSDSVNTVKQILVVRGITRLCVFFGRQKANDVLLSHMVTFLNDKDDRHLRGTFFDNIVGVAAQVGWQCCPILKPLLQQGLTDSDEFVISKALNAMTDLTELGLIQKQMLYDLVGDAIPLLSHPNLWIRQETVGYICAVARSLNLADVQCRLIPLLLPFLKQPLIQVEVELALLNAIKVPLSRCIFNYLVRSPYLLNILRILAERKVQRSITRLGHHPAYEEIDNHMKPVFLRLLSDGMNEAVEDQILAMEGYLKANNINASISVGKGTSPSQDENIVELSSILPNEKLHSLMLPSSDRSLEKQRRISQKKLGKKKTPNIESPTVVMNEEWQHMFGSCETRSPSSSKFQHHSTDPSVASSQKISLKTKELNLCNMTDQGNSPLLSDGKNSSNVISVIDHKPSTNSCVPCQYELRSLIQKKQEEFSRDEIIREASEFGHKEDRSMPNKYRPQGILIAHLHEHNRAINRVIAVPDSSLFATCSSDGTVKVWDCKPMVERNIANRSRQTYSGLDGPVSCLTMCQNMQSLAAASDIGNIHVFRIAQDSSKGKLLHSRELDPQEEGCAVDLHYFDTGSQSVLAYATVFGSIVGWDLRSPGTAWKLESKKGDGLVTSFCVDPHHCWLALGTASGRIICWDLRFQLPITTVTHPSGACIRDLQLHPKLQSAVLTAVQGNNEVSVWDMETQARLLTLWASSAPPLSHSQTFEHSVYSMHAACGETEPTLLTGGSDMRIRYWDMANASASFIVVGAAKDPLSTSHVQYRSRPIDGTQVIQEIIVEKEETNKDPPRRYPEVPPSGHHDTISGITVLSVPQSFVISGSRDGVVKVWK